MNRVRMNWYIIHGLCWSFIKCCTEHPCGEIWQEGPESLIREGPARPEEGPDREPFTLLGLHASRCTGTCDMCHVCSLSESPIREGPAGPEEGPDSELFTLLGLHASRYRGTCVVHAARHVPRHVPCRFAVRIPDQRRTGKTRGRTGQRTLHSVGPPCIPLQRNMRSACC